MGRRDTWYVVIGFVLHFLVVGVSPTSAGVKYSGGTPAACVSFFVGTVFNSPCGVSPTSVGVKYSGGTPLACVLPVGGIIPYFGRKSKYLSAGMRICLVVSRQYLVFSEGGF